jgi:exodeoxyribonuclease VII small subunit
MAKAAKPPASFEAGVSELEDLIAALESGSMPLDEALEKYQRGMELLRFCGDRLAQAEQRVRVLEGDNLKPFNSGTES